jgi:hypothetical protein
MCIAALPAIAAIGQAVVGYVGAGAEADVTNAYYGQNRQNAIVAASDRYASLNNQALQERAAASQELFEKQTEALRTRATAEASAAEAGVTGLSVDALMDDLLAQQGRQRQAIETNYETRRNAIADEGVATYHNTVSRINSAKRAASPSPIPYLLQGVGGAVKA